MVVFSADARVAEIEMRAILFVLVAFAHIDGSVDAAEHTFIRDTVDELVEQRAEESFAGHPAAKSAIVPRWKAHFYHAVSGMDHDIRSDFTESVAHGESATSFVHARLKLRCFELLDRLDGQNRLAVLELCDRLMHADGIVHPAEQAFHAELRALLEDEPTRVAVTGPRSQRGATLLDEARPLPARRADHPFFSSYERAYVHEPRAFAQQAAGDIDLIRRYEAQITDQRSRGGGRLGGALTFGDLAGQDPFLDGHVHVYPPRPDTDYEIIVLGDLHGCYSCLKAALLQADFFAKVEAFQRDPAKNPHPLLVFLGDYIDRGRYSFDGILRTVLRLFLAAPPHVFVLRGNHEHYVEHEGRVLSPVRPAEAIESIAAVAPRELLLAHMRLFDLLPSMLVFDRLLFVHAGIPREDTAAAKLGGLGGFNDPEIRLQMAWSDPSDADFVPLELQRANTRFAFGRMQFRAFMARIGCSVMIRGHERVVEGLRRVYGDPDAMLLSLFSSGGATNEDLPPTSNYREVTPMALTIRHQKGISRVTPFPIAYERYNEQEHNGFLRPRVA
jgi:hypothetical protein